MAERKQIKYEIPEDTPPSPCRGCRAAIYWIKTKADKSMPVDPDGTPHFATCPKSATFKKIADRKRLREAAK